MITRNESYIAEGATVTNSLDEALQTVRDRDESVIIGGANLYAQALSRVDRLHLTRVEGEFEGDAWFPEFSETEWVLSAVETHEPDEKNQYSYRFETYDRRS